MPKLGPIWKPFHRSAEKINDSHHRATHYRCILARKPEGTVLEIVSDDEDDIEDIGKVKRIEKEPWFEEALAQTIVDDEDANGEKSAMAAHLRHCKHATPAEKALAAWENPTKAEQEAAEKSAKEKRKRGAERDDRGSEADDEGAGTGATKKKRKGVVAAEKSMKQATLKAFKGVDMPFTEAQREAIGDQFLRATQSANLPVW